MITDKTILILFNQTIVTALDQSTGHLVTTRTILESSVIIGIVISK